MHADRATFNGVEAHCDVGIFRKPFAKQPGGTRMLHRSSK
jgi:hypothetical protein